MVMYGTDKNGNILGHLERSDRGDVWRGRLKDSFVTATGRKNAVRAMKVELGATKVFTTPEPIHLCGVIIAA